jgi:hypothetical protein
MADNSFSQGPGGRLLRAQADATSVGRDARPNGPYIVQYDKIDWTNPFDWKMGVVKGLKKANTMLGGDIERTGYDRESYSDLINRLEQTPGTAQNVLKSAPKIPNIPSSFAGPANMAINVFNAVRPFVNRGSAAVGDVVLDPVNRAPVGKAAKYGLTLASNVANMPKRAAKILSVLGQYSPLADAGGDVVEAIGEYKKYPTKPKFFREQPQDLTPQQNDFLKKISQYNFANVK